jgi:hypothetical protein
MVRNRLFRELDKLYSPEIKSKQVQLYSFEKIPEYLRSNPYIRTGYRHGLSFKDCLIRYKLTYQICLYIYFYFI